jgi:hypothetical protein
MSLNTIIILFSVLILIGIIVAIVIYGRKNMSREISMQFVQINKAEGYMTLGGSEHLLFSDILNLRQTSQLHTQWNEHGLDNTKYDLVYSKDGMKQVVSLIVYDNEPESVAKRNELKALVAGLRYVRISKIKSK